MGEVGKKDTPESSSIAAGHGGPRGVEGWLLLLITPYTVQHAGHGHGAWTCKTAQHRPHLAGAAGVAGWSTHSHLQWIDHGLAACPAVVPCCDCSVGQGVEGGLRRSRAAVTSHPRAILTYQITSPIEAGWLDC